MPVDHTSPAASGRPYARPTVTALGTLADLTRGPAENGTPDALAGTDESFDGGSL